MTITTTREQRRQLERDNAKRPTCLQEIPRSEWPPMPEGRSTLIRVFRSRDFLVQEFAGSGPVLVRLSINRTTLQSGRWVDGVSWDELQSLKTEVGYGDLDALEVYPAAVDVVNVANVRHLWVMAEPVPFAWRRR